MTSQRRCTSQLAEGDELYRASLYRQTTIILEVLSVLKIIKQDSMHRYAKHGRQLIVAAFKMPKLSLRFNRTVVFLV